MTAQAATSLVQSVDWVAIAPPLIAALGGLLTLVADLFLPEPRKRLLGGFAVGSLAAAGLWLLLLLDGDRATFCLTEAGGECSYVTAHFTLVMQFIAIGGGLLAAVLSLHTVGRWRQESSKSGQPRGEYWFLLLSSVAGAALLPAARDLATLVIALEVASLPAFALVGLGGSRLSAEAAVKFFLSSVAATAVMLLGISFVYAATGSLHLTAVAHGLGQTPDQLGTLAQVGAALTLVGFAFKVAAVPFHFWVPDTYVGAPLPVAAYLSVVGKAAGFSGLILVTQLAFRPYAHTWGAAVAVLSAATMTAGNVAALRQQPGNPHSAVRLLAWSSVAQAGYLLVPLAAAGYAGSATGATPDQMVGTTVAYALMYAVVNLGAFAVAAVVAGTRAENRITDYRGLFAERPLSALALAFFLLCLAGLPPGLIGLFAKVAVFRAAIDAGLGWLAGVLAANVVVALYYYLRWAAVLFARPAGAQPPAAAHPHPSAAAPAPAGAGAALAVPASLAVAIGVTLLLGLVLSGAPQLVLHFASATLF